MSNKDLIKYLEELSQLSLSDEERERISKDLEKTLGYIDILKSVDTSGVSAASHPFDLVSDFREDEVEPSTPREQLLGLAKNKNKEAIIAPKTVD